jgi:putative ABC transport system permease protein
MGDLRLAARALLRRPGFSATVVGTLGLGVGATTALFAVFRGVFLEPLPLPEPASVVLVMQTGTFGCCGPASGPDYIDWSERQRSFQGMAAIHPHFVALSGLAEPERAWATRVTAGAFQTLGVDPLMGRGFQDSDHSDDDVVVLGYDLWQRVLEGRPDVVGEGFEVDGRTRTIVGVMPEGFDVPSPWRRTVRHELYLPFLEEVLQGNRGNHSYPVLARLQEGTSLESAQQDMDRIMRELAVEYPQTNADRGARVFVMHEFLYGDYGRQLLLILGAAAMVLLIACGNVAALQLARGAGREGELAVRSALGASRGAIVRLLFSESVLLALAGGVVGVVVAYGSMDALRAMLPASFPRISEVGMDLQALLFALAVSAVTALLFGMLPALLSARTNVAEGVREGGRGGAAPVKERVRDLFIVGQIAMGLVLANGAGLLVRSYTELRGQEYGFDTEGVMTLSLNPGGPRYEAAAARQRYLEEVSRRVGEVPGVGAVGLVSRLPLDGGSNGNVQVEGWEPRSSHDQGPLVELVSIVGEYLPAMGIPLVQGRMLTADDSIADAVGVLVNEAMVDEVWPSESPLGKRFAFGDAPPWLTVVGVVGNVRQWGPERPVLAQAYVPYSRGWSPSGFLTVRVQGDPTRIGPDVRRAVLEVDPTQPPSEIRGMDEHMKASFAQRRFYTTLIGLFALAALFLASAGVYGTVSYFVARRTREMGIRMALGSGRSSVVGLVVGRGTRLAAVGLGLGLLGVWGTTSVAESVVYGVAALDPVSLVLGCLSLGAITVAASALPALRAAGVSPSLALRAE